MSGSDTISSNSNGNVLADADVDVDADADADADVEVEVELEAGVFTTLRHLLSASSSAGTRLPTHNVPAPTPLADALVVVRLASRRLWCLPPGLLARAAAAAALLRAAYLYFLQQRIARCWAKVNTNTNRNTNSSGADCSSEAASLPQLQLCVVRLLHSHHAPTCHQTIAMLQRAKMPLYFFISYP